MPKINSEIDFNILSQTDCPQLHAWLQEPHVREFWDDGCRTLEQTRAYYYQENGVDRFLFSINHIPSGYIQMYDVNLNSAYQEFFNDNKKTVGIDFFIGNKKFLGKGLAKLILHKFIESYCKEVVRVLVDPNPKNSRAIHVYEKFGFKKIAMCTIKNEPHDIMAYLKKL